MDIQLKLGGCIFIQSIDITACNWRCISMLGDGVGRDEYRDQKHGRFCQIKATGGWCSALFSLRLRTRCKPGSLVYASRGLNSNAGTLHVHYYVNVRVPQQGSKGREDRKGKSIVVDKNPL
jgi:hypothetical protein